jgi:hypothetical protein
MVHKQKWAWRQIYNMGYKTEKYQTTNRQHSCTKYVLETYRRMQYAEEDKLTGSCDAQTVSGIFSVFYIVLFIYVYALTFWHLSFTFKF